LRGVLSKFRWPFEFFFEHIESKLKDFNLQFSCFLCIHLYEWCEFEAILLEWKFIHENLWNLRMKQSSSPK
jgi:hypothetical protein